MSLFNNKLWDTIGKTGELPKVETSVNIDSQVYINIAIALVVSAVIIILVFRITKK